MIKYVLLFYFSHTFDDPEIQQKCISIFRKIGFLFQSENDFIDIFGDPNAVGKIGTDIVENKCTWLSAKCIAIASKDQLDIMNKCYGQNGKRSY